MASISRDVDEIWRALADVRGEGRFSPHDVDDLPAPARRYLRRAIRPGTPLAGRVRLRMHGALRLVPGGRFLSMRAEQIVAPGRGFVWKATVGPWYFRVVGHDAYAGGEGRMRWKLWSVLPVARAGGPDVARSAAGRLAIESIFVPSALLPSAGVSWEPVDDATARATIRADGRESAVDFEVDADGRLRCARMLRWGNQNPAGTYRDEPFGTTTISGERTFSGYTIPTRLSVGWRPGSEDTFEFFRAEIDAAEFG